MSASTTHPPAGPDHGPDPAGPLPEDTTQDLGTAGTSPAPEQECCGQGRMIPVADLAAHPGNVRHDLDLSRAFCASVAEAGVRIPLLITPSGDGYRVIEGHRRLAAAVKAGHTEVPCVLDPARAGDEAGQYLDMAIANSGSLRQNLSPLEEADALFSASEAGATRTRIRKATGRSAAEVKAALRAGQLTGDTRALTADLARQPSLDELALLAEFQDDGDATGQLLDAINHDYPLEHVAERIRRDYAEAAEHDKIVADLEKAGVPITEMLPPGARPLDVLMHDGAELTPQTHAQCPGRGAYFRRWSPTEPFWYCTSPDVHGHVDRYQPAPAAPGQPAPGQPAPGQPSPAGPPDTGSSDPDRRLVLDGNKAWAAAAEVRKRWLRGLLARRTAPPQAARFITAQLLTMPEPLRANLASAHSAGLFAELTGQRAVEMVEASVTAAAGRLPLLMLAPIVTAYEYEISADDPARRCTWRQDRYAPCPRAEAGAYLAFLASLGYQLSVIEQALADGVPYTGDTPAAPTPMSDQAASGEGEPAGAGIPGPGPGGDAGPDGYYEEAGPGNHGQVARPDGHAHHAGPGDHDGEAGPGGHHGDAGPDGHDIHAGPGSHDGNARPHGHDRDAEPDGHDVHAGPDGHDGSDGPGGHDSHAAPDRSEEETETDGRGEDAAPADQDAGQAAA